ncbi:unnamed protein product [Acanthoscelides obtectus]|uniref:Cytochrome P450 n=2 Tax=Acanthoscelides obtectus TaxID=200917 RepID=A0A9P0KHJ3_ACAOB|nr:unnamed protein product [Acanthoscelides obtectus]CAK1664794.1 Cytochrome P450 9e2 [Acanthoscelides obtectus]
MLIFLITLLTIGFGAYFFLKHRYTYWERRGVKQTDAKWIFGDTFRQFFMRETAADQMKRLHDLYPNDRYTGGYQMVVPTFMVRDPDLIKSICVKDFDHFSNHRTFVPEDVDPLFAKNLFALKDQRWREMRAVLSPSFTSSKMRNMFLLMSDCAEKFAKFFMSRTRYGEVIEVNMKDTLTRYTNDVIATCAFGIEVDSLNNPDNSFYTMGKRATDFSSLGRRLKFMGYFLVPWLFRIFNISFFEEDIKQFFYKLVDETIRMREEKGIVRPDMINLMMEARKGKASKIDADEKALDSGFSVVQESNITNGKLSTPIKITNEDIASQVMIFFFGGFDSTASTMCFFAHELIENPDVQSKLREEIMETKAQCNGKLTYEALLKMKYMDMVTSETLRKWPLAVFTDRVCTKPYTIQPAKPGEKPVHLSVGQHLLFPVYGIHHYYKYYPHPERFDPERFSDENKDKINPYSYLPFGLGPRNCIGNRFALLEMKAVFFHLLSHFELVPTEKTQIPLKLSQASINPQAERGFWMGFKKLEN